MAKQERVLVEEYHDLRIFQDLQLWAILKLGIFELSWACFKNGK